MAEKSSELENLENDSDDARIATLDSAEETALETRSGDVSLTADADMDSDEDDDAEETDDGSTPETEQLREQIEETRRGMGETIDAIQEKLSFSNISEQVKDQVSEQIGGAVESVKDAVFGKANDLAKFVNLGVKEIRKSDIAKTAADNPWLLSLIGLGVGALIVTSFSGGKKSKRSADNSKYRYNPNDGDDDVRYADAPRRELKSGGSGGRGAEEESTFQSAKSKIGGAASSAYETVSGAAGTAYEGVGSAASSTYRGIGSAAGATYRGVSGAAGYAYDKAGVLGGQAMKGYDYYIEENPLAVGAVALALGAAIGFAIPLTAKENEYLGEYRDEVFDRVQTTAQEAIGTVKEMAGEAQKVITEEVKSKTA